MKTFTKTLFAFVLAAVYCTGYGASLKFIANNGGTYIPETPVVKANTFTTWSGSELAAGYKSNFNWSELSKNIFKTLNKPQRFRYDFTASNSQASMLGVDLKSAVGTTWNQENLKPTLNAYPNPYKRGDKFRFSLEQTSNARYKISLSNIIGKEMVAIKVPESAHNKGYMVYDLSSYPAGIYFYSLSVNDKLVETKRLIIQQ